MKSLASSVLLVSAAILAIAGSSCGGGGNTTPPPPPPPNVLVSVSPEWVALHADATQQFTATVSGSTATAVSWSVQGCSGDACGTISTTGFYTAPSLIPDSKTISVRATLQSDTAHWGEAVLQHQPVSVDIAASDINLGVAETYQFFATILGHDNTAVSWKLSGCTGEACGTITPDGLYTAPAQLSAQRTVTVTATSKADPTKSDTATIHHVPITVWISPPIVRLEPGTTVALAADVQHDSMNVGVTWSLGSGCAESSCGSLRDASATEVTYTAPATVPESGSITVTATSIRDPSRSARLFITVSSTPGLKAGNYVFLFHGWEDDILGGVDMIAGRFHADGAGNVSEGVIDGNKPWELWHLQALTGTYAVGWDGNGSLSLGDTHILLAVDSSGSRGTIKQVGSLIMDIGSGFFELQDPEALPLDSIAGSYSMLLFGRADSSSVGAVGRFTATAEGALTNGRMDAMTLTGTPVGYTKLALSGTFGAPSGTTGRGVASFSLDPAPANTAMPLNFAYYLISKDRAVLIQTDRRYLDVPTLAGEIRRQKGTFSLASLNAPIIFSMTGDNWFGSTAAAGRMVPDAAGILTGTVDLNDSAMTDLEPAMNQALTGSYAVEADGRAEITMNVGSRATLSDIAYLTDANEGFVLGTAARAETTVGRLEPQTSNAFTATSVAGTFYTTSAVERGASWTTNFSGVTTFDGTDMVLVTEWLGGWFGADRAQYSGTYNVAENGRVEIKFMVPAPPKTVGAWIVSPTRMVGISQADWSPVVLEYQK